MSRLGGRVCAACASRRARRLFGASSTTLVLSTRSCLIAVHLFSSVTSGTLDESKPLDRYEHCCSTFALKDPRLSIQRYGYPIGRLPFKENKTFLARSFEEKRSLVRLTLKEMRVYQWNTIVLFTFSAAAAMCRLPTTIACRDALG
ncbi:hypothetical protein BURKHO8Y_580016 [Burkholderia sp. 8Y]|nr:hypothetical protein BURKHO8Y_580016 [Burkholderia sp. 8Y]